MPRKIFTAGEVLAAADVNNFLMDQSVMTFADADARTAAIPTPTAGMVTYLADQDAFEFFDGTDFVPFGGGDTDFVPVTFLVIAGGGGGGTANNASAGGGGGGAGGYRSSVSGESSGENSSAENSLAISLSTNVTVTVGAGGALRAANTLSTGFPGANSVFAQIVCIGGGGGGGGSSSAGNGGSGGGAAWNRNDEGLGTPNQGFAGGDNAVDFYGGGGGGAGEAGDTDGLGEGGDGISSSITGSAAFRAGGGGGGNNNSAPIGGDGGGGAGATQDTSDGVNGTVNTGGGGGGGYGATNASAAGGSGIVLLRYPSAFTITIGDGLTGTTATVGTNKVTSITAGTGNVSWA